MNHTFSLREFAAHLNENTSLPVDQAEVVAAALYYENDRVGASEALGIPKQSFDRLWRRAVGVQGEARQTTVMFRDDHPNALLSYIYVSLEGPDERNVYLLTDPRSEGDYIVYERTRRKTTTGFELQTRELHFNSQTPLINDYYVNADITSFRDAASRYHILANAGFEGLPLPDECCDYPVTELDVISAFSVGLIGTEEFTAMLDLSPEQVESVSEEYRKYYINSRF
jgi:hypothetical protein